MKALVHTQGSTIRIALDVRVDHVEDVLDVIELSDDATASPFPSVRMSITPTATWLVASNGTIPSFAAMPTGRFVHLELTLQDEGAEKPGTVTASFDGKPVGTVPLSFKIADLTKTTLYINHRGAPHVASEIAYDNVTVDFL